MADRLSRAAEAHGLFLDGQSGNRKERSTEAAVKFMVQAVSYMPHGEPAALLPYCS